MRTTGELKSIQVEAVITRSDGSKEHLGTISSWHRNPLVRFWWWVKQTYKEFSNNG